MELKTRRMESGNNACERNECNKQKKELIRHTIGNRRFSSRGIPYYCTVSLFLFARKIEIVDSSPSD